VLVDYLLSTTNMLLFVGWLKFTVVVYSHDSVRFLIIHTSGGQLCYNYGTIHKVKLYQMIFLSRCLCNLNSSFRVILLADIVFEVLLCCQ
jgi:hypothetical protein